MDKHYDKHHEALAPVSKGNVLVTHYTTLLCLQKECLLKTVILDFFSFPFAAPNLWLKG